MSMNVSLYQNAKVNNLNRMGYWNSLSEQSSYFDGLAMYRENTPTVALGEPLRLKSSVSDLLRYTYGSIDYGDGFRFYFSIDRVEMVTETMSNVYYTIDAYETLVKQRPFSFGRAHLTRYPDQLGKVMLAYSPNVTYERVVRQAGDYVSLVAVRWDSVQNEYSVYTIMEPWNDCNALFDGGWFTKYNIPGTISDIIVTGVTLGRLNDAVGMESYSGLNPSFIGEDRLFGVRKPTIASSHTISQGIRDNRGAIIFQAEPNQTYTVESAILSPSLENVNIELRLKNVETETERYIKLPLEPVSFMIDQWQEYSYRQRTIDKEQRNLQMNKALVNGAISSLGSGVSSAGFGQLSQAGGKASGTMGLLGGLGSLIGTLGEYGSNAFFSGNEQNLIDQQVQFANDMLESLGDATAYEIGQFKKMGIVTITSDADDNNAKDIESNGYNVDYSVDSFASYFKKGCIQGDVEIMNAPVDWIVQIQQRFANGVMIV